MGAEPAVSQSAIDFVLDMGPLWHDGKQINCCNSHVAGAGRGEPHWSYWGRVGKPRWFFF